MDNVKLKGAFAGGGLMKNPSNEICIEAVVNFLKDGTPVEDTILSCEDVRKFVTIRQCTGGAQKDGTFLGKVVRWYYAMGEEGTITRCKLRKGATVGDVVARSLGAKPLMELPAELPEDLDHGWYIKECESLLQDLGVLPKPPVIKKPRRKKDV